MAAQWYGKVLRKNGEGVYQETEMLLGGEAMLLRRTVLVAEETWSLSQRLAVHPCSCADNTGRIPLSLQLHVGLYSQCACLHLMLDCLITFCSLGPSLQFGLEEGVHLGG